jgi:transposase
MVTEPHLPPPAKCSRTRETDLREVVNAIFYIVQICCRVRWVAERTFAWLNRNRRLAKDVEATIESAVSWLFIANVKLMSRRLVGL